MIGKTLKRIRESRGLKQCFVARLVKLRVTRLSSIENGSNPSDSTLNRLAKVYDVPSEVIVFISSPKSENEAYENVKNVTIPELERIFKISPL